MSGRRKRLVRLVVLLQLVVAVSALVALRPDRSDAAPGGPPPPPDALRAVVEDPAGSPRAGHDPAAQTQAGLAAAAARPGASRPAAAGPGPAASGPGSGPTPVRVRSPRLPEQVLPNVRTSGVTSGGCAVGYGRPGAQCVPARAPGNQPLTCAYLVTLFPDGVSVVGRDQLSLDPNRDGVACGPGDPRTPGPPGPPGTPAPTHAH